jgi:xylulokinase
MEGVAFSLRDGMEIIRELGAPVGRVRIAGGGARSALWRQIVADVLGVPVTPEPEERGPAFGAALLAGVAAGVYGSVADACRRIARASASLDPIPANRTRYDDLYGVYTNLYPALQPSFARIAGLQE